MGISDFGLAVKTSHPKERGQYPYLARFSCRPPTDKQLNLS
jgi:hypothetical protein